MKKIITQNRFVPMLFSTPMVEAIDNGTKTETRRTRGLKKINTYPDQWNFKKIDNLFYFTNKFTSKTICVKPQANVNDVIWVRETFQITYFLHPTDENYGYIYKASENGKEWQNNSENWIWKPSLFMKKEACRFFLKCTSVHVERLQDIDEQSAINEGIERLKNDGMMSFRSYAVKHDATVFPYVSFQTLWQKINGKESWSENPFVFVYKFEKVEKPENFV